MTGQSVLAEVADFRVAHAVEVVIFLIILPNVIDTKIEVLAVAATTLGRFVGTGLFAALPLAQRRARFLLGAALALRRDADAIEKF